MNPLETTLRLLALPIAIFLAVIAMLWVWHTYPHNQDFFLSYVLPIYSLFLTMAAVSLSVVSGQVRQFLIIITFISFLFIVEMSLRVIFGILLF